MKALTYKKTFTKYNETLSHQLSQKSYSLYRTIRLKREKKHPIKEFERIMFQDSDPLSESSSDIPSGFDNEHQQEVEGKIKLMYIDFFDYLPKEEIDSFSKKVRHFVLRNNKPKFSSFRSEKDFDRIKRMERYTDNQSFSNLFTVEFAHNKYLLKNAPQIMLSIRNLSTSFLLVRYRVFVSSSFNSKLDDIYRTKYAPHSDVCKEYDVAWYKPHKFGRSYYSGDDARQKEIYFQISELKWNAFCEISRYFKVFFTENKIFPPTFSTYNTNISMDSLENNLSFFASIGLSHNYDYSKAYNMAVGWKENTSESEGISIWALCGGNQSKDSHLPEIAEFEISDTFSVYLVASTIQKIAVRDIALCNKKISKAIRKSKSTKQLSVRSKVERELYYSYRFIGEFTGATIEHEDVKSFSNKIFNSGSISERTFHNITSSITNTKQQIDNLLCLLNDAAEFSSSKSNMAIQWFMVIITIMSLVVAIIALFERS